MISRILAVEMAGEIVEGSARFKRGRWRKLEVESESGLGSKAFRRRNNDRSVSVPSRPPSSLRGEVSPRQGTLTRKRGRAAPKATSDESAASLKSVNIVRWAMAAEETGAVGEESEGMCANGIRKARKLHGRDGRDLIHVSYPQSLGVAS